MTMSGLAGGPVVLIADPYQCQSSVIAQENYSDLACKLSNYGEQSVSRDNAQESGKAVRGRGKGKLSLISPNALASPLACGSCVTSPD